jgi:hypothetical protein
MNQISRVSSIAELLPKNIVAGASVMSRSVVSHFEKTAVSAANGRLVTTSLAQRLLPQCEPAHSRNPILPIKDANSSICSHGDAEMCHESCFHSLIGVEQLVRCLRRVRKDTNEALRDHLVFCSQFIIHDPDPRIVLNQMRDCCAFSQHIHDCHVHDWSIIERW